MELNLLIHFCYQEYNADISKAKRNVRTKGLAHSLKYSVQIKSGKNNSVAFSFHCLNTTQEVYT